jgi:hypothetical protein
MLSGVGFLPGVAGVRHSSESGNPERGRQSWAKSLDARLRGHDGLAYPAGR